MFRFIWQLYTGGILIFFLLFLLVEETPFCPRTDQCNLLAGRNLQDLLRRSLSLSQSAGPGAREVYSPGGGMNRRPKHASLQGEWVLVGFGLFASCQTGDLSV